MSYTGRLLMFLEQRYAFWLSDLIEFGIIRHERDTIDIFCDNDQVFVVIGICVCNIFILVFERIQDTCIVREYDRVFFCFFDICFVCEFKFYCILVCQKVIG